MGGNDNVNLDDNRKGRFRNESDASPCYLFLHFLFSSQKLFLFLHRNKEMVRI